MNYNNLRRPFVITQPTLDFSAQNFRIFENFKGALAAQKSVLESSGFTKMRSKNFKTRVSVVYNVICRLNSRIGNRHNYFRRAIFLFPKIENDSVNHADSGDIKIFIRFPGNSSLKFLLIF